MSPTRGKTAVLAACLASALLIAGCNDGVRGQAPADADTNAWIELKDRRLQAHKESIGSLGFSSDGERLASGSYDKTVRVLGMPQDFLQRITGHVGPVTFVAFAPDGESVFSSAQGGAARLWRVSDGAQLERFDVASSSQVAVSLDGKTLAVGESLANETPGAKVRLIRISDGKLLRTLNGHKRYVASLAFRPDGELLASGGGDGEVHLWSVADGALLQTMKQDGRVGTVEFSSDGTLLASGGDHHGILRVWRVSDSKLLLDRTLHAISDISFSRDGALLAICSTSDEIPHVSLRLLQVSTGELVQILVDEQPAARRVSFHPTKNLLPLACRTE